MEAARAAVTRGLPDGGAAADPCLQQGFSAPVAAVRESPPYDGAAGADVSGGAVDSRACVAASIGVFRAADADAGACAHESCSFGGVYQPAGLAASPMLAFEASESSHVERRRRRRAWRVEAFTEGRTDAPVATSTQRHNNRPTLALENVHYVTSALAIDATAASPRAFREAADAVCGASWDAVRERVRRSTQPALRARARPLHDAAVVCPPRHRRNASRRNRNSRTRAPRL
jgi:hypothetical protein